MMRAGNYLCLLEDRLNRELVGQGALTTPDGVGLIWENWLRSQTSSGVFDPHTIHYWVQRVIFMLVFGIAGIAVATLTTGNYEALPINKWVFVGIYTLFALALFLLSWPIVVHTRKGPTAYVLKDSQVYGEFKNWLDRYRDSL